MLPAAPSCCGGLVNQSGSDPGDVVLPAGSLLATAGPTAAAAAELLTGGAMGLGTGGDTGVPVIEIS